MAEPYQFPSRELWEQQHRTIYADDVEQVQDGVSARVADYATPAEITQASAELGELWRQLGRDLREANRRALAVFPLHGHRARRRASVSAIWRLRETLTPADEAVVAEAEAIKDHRARVNEAVDLLVGDGYLGGWAIHRVLERLPDGACPTWRGIVGRWGAARRQAGAAYAEQVRRRAVDDAAWGKELDRRAEIERWRASGHITSRRSA